MEGPAFDASGRLWVLDVLGGGIYRIGPDGQCTLRGSTGGMPNGARFRSDGALIVADGKKGILAIDPSTMTVTVLADSYLGSPIRTANDLAIDRAGGIYVTVPNGSSATNPIGKVFYLPPGPGAKLQVFADHLAFPNGIALSANGDEVFIGIMAEKTIVSLPVVGSRQPIALAYVVARTSGGIGPDGMAIDSAGRLFWANFKGGSLGWINDRAEIMPPLSLKPPAGRGTTNMAFHDGWIYVTEGFNGQIWRIPQPK
jgi:gluconolactonase